MCVCVCVCSCVLGGCVCYLLFHTCSILNLMKACTTMSHGTTSQPWIQDYKDERTNNKYIYFNSLVVLLLFNYRVLCCTVIIICHQHHVNMSLMDWRPLPYQLSVYARWRVISTCYCTSFNDWRMASCDQAGASEESTVSFSTYYNRSCINVH